MRKVIASPFVTLDGFMAGPQGGIVIDGSPDLIHSLTRFGLIDEYRLRVHPVVLGSRVPLFKDLKERMPLQLIDSQTFHSGVVILHYQRA